MFSCKACCRNLSLREDVITAGNCQKDILKNADVTEDDYFVAPPGNIPLHDIETESNIPIEEKQNVNRVTEDI